MNTSLVLNYKSQGLIYVYHEAGKYIGDFVCGDDGYFDWWPDSHEGSLSGANLYDLYQNLEALNKEWDSIVQNDPKIGGLEYVDSRD